MRLLLLYIGFCFLAPRLGATEPVPTQGPDLINEALPLLQNSYVDFTALQYQKGDHLADLIGRSKGNISLVPALAKLDHTLPVTATLLPDKVIYCRLASFTLPKGWEPILTQLQEWKEQGAIGVIFDVRANGDADDYVGARNMANLVVPANTPIFAWGHPSAGTKTGQVENQAWPAQQQAQLFRGPVVVLVDGRTTGAGEALAALLRKYCGALIIGQPTAGRIAVFEERELSSGATLRFASAYITLPDGTALSNQPVMPDIQLAVSSQNEKAALMLIERNRIGEVIQESTERRRLSEAALVQGEDPEWDDYLRTLKPKPVLLSLPIIHDKILIAALDSLKAIQVSQRPAASPATASSPPASASRQ